MGWDGMQIVLIRVWICSGQRVYSILVSKVGVKVLAHEISCLIYWLNSSRSSGVGSRGIVGI